MSGWCRRTHRLVQTVVWPRRRACRSQPLCRTPSHMCSRDAHGIDWWLIVRVSSDASLVPSELVVIILMQGLTIERCA